MGRQNASKYVMLGRRGPNFSSRLTGRDFSGRITLQNGYDDVFGCTILTAKLGFAPAALAIIFVHTSSAHSISPRSSANASTVGVVATTTISESCSLWISLGIFLSS